MKNLRQFISSDYYIQNKRIAETDLSIIRSIMDIKHHENYSRISLGLGELTFPIPEKVQEANAKAIKEGKTQYTPNAGLPELRDEVAKRYSLQTGLALTKNNVIITSGSTGGLYIAFETFLNPNDEVLIPELYYPLYKTLPEKWSAKVIQYQLTDSFDLDVSDILKKITKKTKLIVINSPSNPTGQLVSKSSLLELANETKNHPSLFFLSDEIYSSCVFEGAVSQSIAYFSNRVIIIDGLSKQASMTGKRLGWIIGPEFFINDAFKSQQSTYVCAPTDSQYAAFPVLEGKCDNDIKYYQRELDRRRTLMGSLLKQIARIQFLDSHGAFYYFVNVSKYGDGMTAAKKIIEKVNVITVPGIAFGVAGTNYLRLSYAATDEDIREGLARMKGVFDSWE